MSTKQERSAQRSTFAVQAENEKKFSRSYNKLVRDLITPKIKRDLLRALKKPGATPAKVMRAVPFFDPTEDEAVDVWVKHAEQLARAYEDAIEQTEESQKRKHKWKFDVEKAIKIPRLPKNPTPEQWIKHRSLSRIVELSGQEKKRLRSILGAMMKRGGRAEDIVDEIAETVGLTSTQWGVVQNRLAVATEGGATKAATRRLRDGFAGDMQRQRAKTIARTETIDAQAAGLESVWNKAKEDGNIPKGTKKRWVAFNDDVTSDICEELDGQEVPLDEQFDSSIVGAVDRPPAHPNCRSTMVLVFP